MFKKIKNILKLHDATTDLFSLRELPNMLLLLFNFFGNFIKLMQAKSHKADPTEHMSDY